MNLDLSKNKREDIWKYIISALEDFYTNTADLKVSPELNIEKVVAYVSQFDFEKPIASFEAIDHVINGLKEFAVHTPHPAYFGLFNPRANFPGILADLITAVFNPQMAAWSHAPFANEVEIYLLKSFGKKFGYPESQIDGVFTGGGAEANLTTVLCALNHHFPEYANEGLIQLGKKPVIYTSEQSHHSVVKAARAVGLGLNAVRNIPADEKLALKTEILQQQIEKDIKEGFNPFMIVATAGTTGAGAFDPLPEIAAIAKKDKLWFHVDAAYGGAVVMDEKLKDLLKGIEHSNSLTFDAHKWLSVPMATSLFVTREKEILSQTFRVDADYMPKEASQMEIKDPFTHSIQWSRRFIGLKLYISMLFFGWEGYANVIRHQVAMGDLLKKLLVNSGWKMYNDTPLPIACFALEVFEKNPALALTICEKIIKSGKAWISVYKIGEINTLRACITNYATTEKEVQLLVDLLNQYKEELSH